MKPRRTRVRSRIAVLLIALVALWAIAAYVTVSSGLHLWYTGILDTGVGRPTNALVNALQNERRAAVSGDRSGYAQAQSATDGARAAYQRAAADTLVGWAAPAEVRAALSSLDGQLGRIAHAARDRRRYRRVHDRDRGRSAGAVPTAAGRR